MTPPGTTHLRGSVPPASAPWRLWCRLEFVVRQWPCPGRESQEWSRQGDWNSAVVGPVRVVSGRGVVPEASTSPAFEVTPTGGREALYAYSTANHKSGSGAKVFPSTCAKRQISDPRPNCSGKPKVVRKIAGALFCPPPMVGKMPGQSHILRDRTGLSTCSCAGRAQGARVSPTRCSRLSTTPVDDVLHKAVSGAYGGTS